jgi:hypothetical protein
MNKLSSIKLFVLLIVCSCAQKSIENERQTGFYYWKSTDLTSFEEKQMIAKTNTTKLYIKFFEVVEDQQLTFIPIDISHVTYNKNVEIIPTIFIKNTALFGKSFKQIDQLATKMSDLILNIYKTNFKTNEVPKEVQIDCDWTPKSKDNYFKLLEEIKKNIKTTLSCTLRLYPYKYSKITGVPPADRCMLMCYNLISPQGNPNKNSILDLNELKSYLVNSEKYPVPLDLALPVFSWIHHYKLDQFQGLIQSNDSLFSSTLTQEKKSMWYRANKDFSIDQKFIRAGDRLKWEKITQKLLLKSLKTIKENVPLEANSTLAFFDINPTFCNNFTHENISSLHTSFRK